MNEDDIYIKLRGFGLVPLREEGAPYHPDDIGVPDGTYETESYKRWYQKQLAAYNKYMEAKKNNEDPSNS